MDDTLVTDVVSGFTLEYVVKLMKEGAGAVFDIGVDAFNFLLANPLCTFYVCTGFAFTGLSLVRKAIRAAKRT